MTKEEIIKLELPRSEVQWILEELEGTESNTQGLWTAGYLEMTHRVQKALKKALDK